MSYYGTPRATRNYAKTKTIAPQICMCLSCAAYAYNPENNKMLRGGAFHDWLQGVVYNDVIDFLQDDDVENFVSNVKAGKVIDNSIKDSDKSLQLLLEGQLNEQLYLDHYHCEVCDIRLHKLCVDY
jgi:hypothetical protein